MHISVSHHAERASSGELSDFGREAIQHEQDDGRTWQSADIRFPTHVVAIDVDASARDARPILLDNSSAPSPTLIGETSAGRAVLSLELRVMVILCRRERHSL